MYTNMKCDLIGDKITMRNIMLAGKRPFFCSWCVGGKPIFIGISDLDQLYFTYYPSKFERLTCRTN